MSNEDRRTPCTASEICGWAIVGGEVICVRTLYPDYYTEPILEAKLSKFHDKGLKDATKEIQKVLSKIPKDPDGRVLGFVGTEVGLLLSWISHKDIDVESRVAPITPKDKNSDIIEALGITNANLPEDQ